MSVSKFTSSSGINDFNLNIQATNSTITFDAEKSQGSYSIASSSNDTSIDFYAYASDGSLAGYTANKSFTASRNFNKMVILGGTIGDVIGFTYKTTYATSQETAETTAGPYITGVSPSSLPNVNSTTTVTGGNFASGITATFYGSDALIYPAKSVVVGTPQSLIVTRPDVFPISASPYTLKVLNPGVADPTGSAVNVLSNGITAGAAPSWTTASGVIGVFSKNVPFNATVVATDADGGSTITYSVAPGYSLPAGLSIGSSSGIISGTPTVSSPVTFNLRATDSGGNYVDRAFTLSDSGPVWITSGTITSGTRTVAYSYQLSAPDDSGVAPTYTLATGSLPAGLSLSSNGLLSGTPTAAATSTFTVNATDANSTTTQSGTLTLVINGLLTPFVFGTASGTSGWGYGGPEDDIIATITGGSGTVLFAGISCPPSTNPGTAILYSGNNNNTSILASTSSYTTDAYGQYRYLFATPIAVNYSQSYEVGYYQSGGNSSSIGSKSNPQTVNGITITQSTANFNGRSNNGTSPTSGQIGIIWLYI